MSSYKKEKKVSYDMKKYQFIEMLNDVLGSNDMSMLHTSAKNDYNIEYSIERLIKSIKLEYKEDKKQIELKYTQNSSTNCCRY